MLNEAEEGEVKASGVQGGAAETPVLLFDLDGSVTQSMIEVADKEGDGAGREQERGEHVEQENPAPGH